MTAMDIREVIGARVKDAREVAGLSQEALGQAVSEYLGRPWKRQAVSVAEKGGRDFVATELMVLSLILKQPLSYFFMPRSLEGAVETPSGKRIEWAEAATRLMAGDGDYGEALARGYLEYMTADLVKSLLITEQMAALTRKIMETVLTQAAALVPDNPSSDRLLEALKEIGTEPTTGEGKSE